MQAHGCQALGVRVEVPLDRVGGGDVARVGVGVAQEVGQRDGREAVVVGVVLGVEFDHFEGCEGGEGGGVLSGFLLADASEGGGGAATAVGMRLVGKGRQRPSPGYDGGVR